MTRAYEKKQVLRYDHGRVTFRHFRKLYQTDQQIDRPTDHPSDRPTDGQPGHREVTLSITRHLKTNITGQASNSLRLPFNRGAFFMFVYVY